MMTSSSTDNASPSSSRPQLRAYDSFISNSSPKAQAIFVAPLNRFRRKTTDLVGQITGAQVKEEVLSDERRRREERRRAKCRACKVEFAGERELSKHLELFPAHLEIIEARRQGRRRATEPDARSASELPPYSEVANDSPEPISPNAKGSQAFPVYQSSGDESSSSSNPAAGSSSHHSRTASRHRTTSAGMDQLAADIGDLRIPGRFESSQEEAFTRIGPMHAVRRAASRPTLQSSATSPPPLIDYAARNEEQGRESVRKVQEARRRARIAAEQQQIAEQARRDKRIVRAGTSDSLLDRVARATRTRDPRDDVVRERARRISNRRSDEDQVDPGDVLELHGEVRPLELAPSVVSLSSQPSSNGSDSTLVASHRPYFLPNSVPMMTRSGGLIDFMPGPPTPAATETVAANRGTSAAAQSPTQRQAAADFYLDQAVFGTPLQRSVPEPYAQATTTPERPLRMHSRPRVGADPLRPLDLQPDSPFSMNSNDTDLSGTHSQPSSTPATPLTPVHGGYERDFEAGDVAPTLASPFWADMAACPSPTAPHSTNARHSGSKGKAPARRSPPQSNTGNYEVSGSRAAPPPATSPQDYFGAPLRQQHPPPTAALMSRSVRQPPSTSATARPPIPGAPAYPPRTRAV